MAALVEDHDWLVSLRALDLLEKLSHDHADWIAPHRCVFIGPVADSREWERQLQIVRALPFFAWTDTERPRVVRILTRNLDHARLFVRAWALDSLASFAQADAALMPQVHRHLARFARSGRPSLVARARAIRRRLGGPR